MVNEKEYNDLVLLSSKKDYNGINDKVDELLKKEPEDAFLLYMKADSSFHLEDYNNALKYIDKSLKIDPKNGVGWLLKGALMGKMKLFDSCFSCLDLAAKTLDDPTIALYVKGDILLAGEDYVQALRTFSELLSINPTHEDAYFKKGECLFNLGEFEEAVAAYTKVLDIDITNTYDAEAYLRRVECYIQLGRLNDALISNEIVIKAIPKFIQPWIQRARILAILGENEEAIKSINKALEINPNNVAALKLRNMIINNI